ncbi:MAG TPA: hydroxymethylbilane synthase [Candidatus Anaerostipes excrementavium]|uniref:Porphobilinogen deaminase n=1 Tax=Candidatus Anaerostipes excrementavium TaxID=2838463 RepID=A0A9D1WXT6_9FIRM|nr:hydroxymethylbilane synthase [uncultured Anaerostipes sp.]HIX68000.1 hydroxymethylbilane synthase [Candidatus Anaerostipes excrementavium]
MNYKIGSRGSKLALIQTKYVCQRLKERYPEHDFEIVIVKTKGDRIQNKPLDQIGGKGLFVKEIEEMILADEIQMGVHSMKDMPALPAPGLIFAKAWKREDPRDALILREKHSLEELLPGAVIGTGSKRRAFQLKKLRPDLKVEGIRGNVDTRLRKMEEQKLDGIILAAAGLRRLGMEDRISMYFSEDEMVPAPAQGVLALELREDNKELLEMLEACADAESHKEASAERSFLEAMGGSCHVPIGASCKKIKDGQYRFYGLFGTEDGNRMESVFLEGEDPQELAQKSAIEIQKRMAGTVFLIGAGPGDPDLITVKGKKLVEAADCVIYDRLIAPELLNMVKHDCELIYVGKENHHHVMEQEKINQLLAKKAMEYPLVVRLKGGDPFVFGRGGEEALYLREQGIPVQIVPGISSCIAGPAYAGIPVTHRGLTKGFHVVTAHDRKDQFANIDFQGLVRSEETLVFLMGFSKLEQIAENLIGAGMSASMPAAVISNAATSQQKSCIGTLENIVEKVKEDRLKPPAVIVVGKTVDLAAVLSSKDHTNKKKPYVVTKIGKAPSPLTDLLQKKGFDAKEIQTGEITAFPQKFTEENLQKVSWIVFTSRNGVDGFMENLYASGMDVRALSSVRIAVIGEKTGKRLKHYGILADLKPEIQNTEEMVRCLEKVIKKEDTLWYVKGRAENPCLKKKMESRCDYHEWIVYENQPIEIEEIHAADSYEGVLFTCASSVKRFFGSMKEETARQWKNEVPCYSIGPKTTEALRQIGAKKMIESDKASYESLADKAIQYTKGERR